MMVFCLFFIRNLIDIRVSFCFLFINIGSYLKYKIIYVFNLKVFFYFLSFSFLFWNGVSIIYDKFIIYMLNFFFLKV